MSDTKSDAKQDAGDEEDAKALERWSSEKAASEKKAQYPADVSWLECEALAEDAGQMLCGRCRAGVSFARGCNSESDVCYGTVCRTCSDAGLLCHDHAADKRPNDF